ncbi:MAG: hypothetical protein J5729_03995 [Bacteroidaceae bacterium]|nr:hypothetical protein [Bacteroidaceae bacterium]
MKKIVMAALLALLSLNMMATSDSRLREYARFLSDRMAYELDLTPMQYDDCYEINLDFLYATDRIMDDVVYGYIDAIDRYYDYLDYRNEDLRHVLDYGQYARFLNTEYFYRPIYTRSNSWYLRIYNVYSNRSFYYFDRPSGYLVYRGAHARRAYPNGYYSSRYSVDRRYRATVRIRDGRDYDMHRRTDFGANIRQRTEKPRANYYRNRDQRDRTSDPRYRNDRPANVNSPQINGRNQQRPSDNRPPANNQPRNNQPRNNQPQAKPQPPHSGGGGGVVRQGHR